jgi:ComF family protein
VKQFFIQFFRLFFPLNCPACGSHLLEGERFICSNCMYEIPKTGFHKTEDNPVNRLFYGITRVKYATAFFYFIKGSKYRHLIHKLKYAGRQDIGKELGKMLGSELKGSFFDETEIIIPVPLHPTKQRMRGYNQSEMIAEGISEILGKPLLRNVLERSIFTQTQTRKSLEERRENVKEAFRVKDPELLKGKHLLLVDDVITTGSTLTACADELLKVEGVTVSVAAIAFADT